VVQSRHPHIRLWHLNISPSTAPTCRTSQCQVSVARKWQLASRRHLLQICCPPSVLVSTVQGLTDHPCCAAGSSKNQNHNSEEHLDAGSASVCVAEMLSAVIYSGWMFTNLHVTQLLTIGCQNSGGESYDRPGTGLLLICCSDVLSLCIMAWCNVPRTYLPLQIECHCVDLDKGEGYGKFKVKIYILITNLMHELLFIHKILISSTCFEPQVRLCNKFSFVPLAYATNMKETYQNLKILLEKIQYDKYCWTICWDLKVIALLMSLQLRYTKFCCFLCELDSRDKKKIITSRRNSQRGNQLRLDKKMLYIPH